MTAMNRGGINTKSFLRTLPRKPANFISIIGAHVMDMIHILLFNGADLVAFGNDGSTAPDLAVQADKADAAAILKEGITRRFRKKRGAAHESQPATHPCPLT